jgi:hypothetical protein
MHEMASSSRAAVPSYQPSLPSGGFVGADVDVIVISAYTSAVARRDFRQSMLTLDQVACLSIL